MTEAGLDGQRLIAGQPHLSWPAGGFVWKPGRHVQALYPALPEFRYQLPEDLIGIRSNLLNVDLV
jgi:hypothetical protein